MRELPRLLLLPLAVLAATLPARLWLMDRSLWLDEVWVANSVLTETWREMFAYKNWVQSSPPVFLVFTRLIAAVSGSSEWSLRIWAWIASALAVPVFFLAARTMFSRNLALLGATLLATNYWTIKMAQQVKQYSGDVLASALLLWAVSAIATERKLHPAALIALACAGPWFSMPTAFWLPSVALILVRKGWVNLPSTTRLRNLAVAGTLIASSLAACYLLVLQPAMSESMARNWRPYQFSLADPLASALAFGSNVAYLLLPPASGLVYVASWAMVGVIVFGAMRPTGTPLLMGVLPIVTCLAASMAERYPVTAYPRMIMWMLPCLAVLALSGIQPLVTWLERRHAKAANVSVSVMCVAAAAAISFVWPRLPHRTEHNRPAMQMLKEAVAANDIVYIHGGVSEAFTYYTRRLGWRPANVYLGNSNWPCCSQDLGRLVTDSSIRNLTEEMQRIGRMTRGHRVWIYSPSGADGHYSGSFRARLQETPSVLAAFGCVEERRGNFEYVSVVAFRCK